jgi:hypothetical protein
MKESAERRVKSVRSDLQERTDLNGSQRLWRIDTTHQPMTNERTNLRSELWAVHIDPSEKIFSIFGVLSLEAFEDYSGPGVRIHS